ncbi:MAG: chorismate-binding protein [Spirochaetia bacterium]|jgi:anthranilate synthase component 1|nr:chorismate-binding protein [Spirochaetia bacterium]
MKCYPSLAQAKSYEASFTTIPISRTIPLEKRSATDILAILQQVSKHCFLLESCEDSKNWGRYSFLGFDPSLEITMLGEDLCIRSGTELHLKAEKPHPYLRKILSENRSPLVEGLPPFTGGLVGYFSYDFIAYSEPVLRLDAEDEEGFNDLDLMLFDKLIAIDNLEQKIFLIVNIKRNDIETSYSKGVLALQNMEYLLTQHTEPKLEKHGRLLGPLVPLFSKDEYCTMVEKAKKHIYDGDIFQVVLSNRLVAPYEGSLKQVYAALRQMNPSPYMFYFSSDEIEIAGASPETLVKLEDRKLSTFPLAGTKPRGRDKAEDDRLETELLTDEKEKAEHTMLVDLGRNDIGKISCFGSVNVEKYMKVEKFSHVMHLGSTVTGTLRDDLDSLDAIDSILPAGTLSGAPKIRACQLINELEHNKRGIYGGAIGYLSFSGGLDTCIAIRLAFKKHGKVYVRSGAGIVADSVPEKEHQECLNKAQAVINALEEEA